VCFAKNFAFFAVKIKQNDFQAKNPPTISSTGSR
jgi:hypothetical protein